MKVMVTGGAGYIGNELVYRLSAEPGIKDILVYDNLCKGNYNLFTGLRKITGNNVRFIQADILDSRSLRKHMEGVDVVIHLAAKVETPYADQNAHDFEQTNHWGTAEVVYTAEEVGVKRLMYLSSQSVYGQGEVTTTDHPRVPSSYYSISKMRGEDHPMLNWDSKMVYYYRKYHDLPEHPLEAQGYMSIGCEPCTSKAGEGNERNSRWFGMNKTECGLNTTLVAGGN